MSTKIEWTDETWNPLIGCSKVGPGCDHCYAIGVVHRKMSPQHVGLTVKPDGAPVDWTGEVRTVPHLLDAPLRWRRPRKVFVNSLSDLFHPDVPDEFIARVFAVMALAPQHTFQVLTKRPQRMAAVLTRSHFPLDVERAEIRYRYDHGMSCMGSGFSWPLPNVWLGTSIETDRYAFRADHLRATPAAVRFVSAEPLLSALPSLDLTGIGWVIAGGESGPGARPMHPTWARDLRDRCEHQGVPFLFKQWGNWLPYEPDAQPPFWAPQDGSGFVDGHDLPVDLSDQRPTGGWWAPPGHDCVIYRRLPKSSAGRFLDEALHDGYPEPRS